MRLVRGSFVLCVSCGLLLGCPSLTRPDDDALGVARAEPSVAVAPSPSIAPSIAKPTNEGNAANGMNVALAVSPPQPVASPPPAKQGG